MEFRILKAKELCKWCRTKGLPSVHFVGYSTRDKKGTYAHSFLDAAGDGDYEECEANEFLKNLDKFACMTEQEWNSLS